MNILYVTAHLNFAIFTNAVKIPLRNSGNCSTFEGLINPTEPSKCCAKDCYDFCGAKNCHEKGSDKCCGDSISPEICGVDGCVAPCTLGIKLKIHEFGFILKYVCALNKTQK